MKFIAKYNPFFPIFVLLGNYLLLEIAKSYPKAIYICAALAALAIILTLKSFTAESDVAHDWWNFSILPVFFQSALLLYATIISAGWLVHVLFVVSCFFVYFYLRACYLYLLAPSFYQIASIEHFSQFGNFLCFYFLSSAIFGLEVILGTSPWVMILLLAALSLVAVYQIMWAHKIEFRKITLYLLIVSLVILELAWSLSYLPLNFNVLGLILSIFYYMLIGLTRLDILHKLDKKLVKSYLWYGFTAIIVLLLTSRWI